MPSPRLLLASLILVFVGGPAWGAPDDDQIDPKVMDQVRKFLKVSYAFRRTEPDDDRRLKYAVEALEQAIDLLPPGRRRHQLIMEAGLIYQVMDAPIRAVYLYRRTGKFRHEVDTLLEIEDRLDEALGVARLVKYRKGEAICLFRMAGKNGKKLKEAVAFLREHNLRETEAELLMEHGRYAQAADVWGELDRLYEQADALHKAGQTQDAELVYGDASVLLEQEIRTKSEEVNRARALIRDERRVPDGIARERTRQMLARVSGEASVLYERWGISRARSGQDKWEKAIDLAIKYCRFQRSILIDKGQDRSGPAYVAYFGLDERLRALEALKADLAGQRE